MHPQRVSLADICDVTERIKGSIYCGTSCCIDVEWNQTLPYRSWCKFIQVTVALFFFFANHQRSPLRKTFTFFLAETMAASSSAEIIFPLKTGNIHTNVWAILIVGLYLTWKSHFEKYTAIKIKVSVSSHCRTELQKQCYKTTLKSFITSTSYWYSLLNE